ncbi:MAG: acyltransferase family protein [Lachnospiraceae bacterium]|nr:acyltransferase family protein [Lachnospiraceae bacterium]MBF1012901.1 acyltransferase family protein [Lachnospiraceae bacterium]
MSKGITSKQSVMLQGLAAAMMLYHHLFIRPDMLFVEYSTLLGETREIRLALFCKLCVAIYAFVSGYGMCSVFLRAASEGKEEMRFFTLLRQDYTLVLQKLLRFFSIYWFCVLLYFICENLFLGKEKPLSELLPNLLALSDSFNGSWWYALEYVKILLFLPLLHLLFVFEKDHEERLKKKWFFLALFGLLALFLVLALNLFPSWEYHFRLFVNRLMPSYLLCAAGGFLIARFSLIPSLGKLCISLLPRVQGPVQEETFRRSRDQGPVQEALPCRSRRLSALLSLGGLLLMFLPFLIRYLITVDAMQTSLDFLLTPVFCLGFLLFLGDQKIPAQIFFFIGKHSVYIWLLHLMFLDGFFRDLVMASHTAIGIYLTLLFFSLLCAILLRTVYTAFSGWLLLHLKPFLHALQTAPSTSKEGENH